MAVMSGRGDLPSLVVYVDDGQTQFTQAGLDGSSITRYDDVEMADVEQFGGHAAHVFKVYLGQTVGQTGEIVVR